ncbi:MAG: DUF11 domain-containing protein, partial [Leptolinea sp.]|nr:DUF11 domain-containing protein [Leptolinea sp.]
VLSVTLKGLNGQPVADKPVNLRLLSGRQVFVNGTLASEDLISIGNTNIEGVATAQVSSNVSEQKLFDVFGDGALLTQKGQLTFIAGPVSLSQSRFLVEPLTVEADNEHFATVTIELKDAQSNPVVNHQIGLTVSGIEASITQPDPPVTDASGLFTATIKSMDVGKANINAQDITQTIVLGTAEVDFIAGIVDPVRSTIQASTQILKANGTDMALYVVTLMDSWDRPLSGHEVEVSVSGWDNIINGPAPQLTGADGKANFSLSSTRVETKTLTFRDKTVGITLRQMPVITFVDPSIDPSDDGACVQPVEGLVDWWPFDGNMSDVAGGRDGSPSFDIAYASGLVGQGLNFDGIDDSVGLGNWFDYQDFSISMWIKPDSIQTSDARILDNNFISSQNWSIQQNNNQTNHYLWSGDIGYLSSNKWQHLVISHDGSGVSKSYVDGVLTNTTQSGQINYNSSRFLHLGQAEAGGNNWNGLLDDLDVYNRALSQDEIKNIYFAGTAGKCKLTDSTESIVTATNTSVVANDVDTASVNVSLNDIYGGALAGHAVSLTISGSGNTIVSPSPVLTDQEGKASFTFTSTRAEDKTLTVKNETQGVVLKTKPIVNFVADTVSPDVSTVSADEAVTANNSSKATVVVTLLDINSNPVSNHEIELATTGTNVTLEAISAVTNEVGQAQFTARSGQLQTVTITARDKTAGIDLTSSANVEFVSTDGSTSVVTADPTSVIADGQQSISVLVTLKDFNGQPVIDKPVSLKITSGSQVFINGTAAATEAIALGNTNASGTATALVTSTKAEIKTIEIIGDRIKLDQVLTVSFAPGAVSTEKSRFTIDPLFLVGDGVQEAAITVELKDAFENPISNHQIGFVTSGINATITQTTPNTDADGKLTASIKSLELGKVLVSANDVTENVSLGNPIEVSFVNGLSDPDKSTVLVSPDSIAADGIAKATITVTLMDNQNRPLPDHEVELTSSGTTNTILGPVPLMTSGDGKATFTIASTESGIKTLTVRDKTINLTLNTAPKITFNPGPVSLNNITITAAPLEAPADGITPITLTATARDIYNNPVPGVPLTLRISGTTAVLGQTETVTDSLGQIKGIVKDTVIEKTMAGVLFNETAAAATVELSFRGPDIAVVLSGPERAAPGDSLTYTIFAQNKNMMAAEGVDISLQLPTDVTYVSQDSPVVPVIQGNTLKWTLGSLAGSTSVQFTVKVDVNNTVTVGTELKATAVVTSTMDDGNPTNNQVEVNTIVADALSVDASINPTFSSLPIGGETTFTIHILNTGLKVDTYNLSVEGLSPGWITLDRSLVNLLPGDSVDVLLKVAVRSCQFEEEIPFSVKVTSQQGEKTTTLNAKLMVVTAPQVWIDSPGDKSTLGSTSVLFAWRTNPASSGVLTIYPESHPELAQTYTSTESNNHSLKIENFARNTTYFWKLDSTTACGASQGAWRQFRVENGIVFSEIPTEYTIDRDYNQILRVLAKNEDVVVHSLKADLINPNEDLIANFVGSGSIDETINLGPGEIRELNLAVHAQDTVKTSYQLTAHLLTDGSTPKPIEDNATIKINILPSGDFSIDEDTSAYDPKFLAHTYIITNNGSTITDLSLKAIDPVTKLPARIFLKPSINHARLERGGTLKVVAYPIFDASDMEQDSSGGLQSQISDNRVFSRSQKGEIPAEITATGAGNTQTKPVTLNCQAKIFEVTHTDETLVCGSKDWYCTNRPNVTTNIGSPPNIKEANIKSASLSMIFTPWSNVLPHSGKIDFNKNQIGVFDSLVPNGAFSYDLDPQLINSVIAGPASQKVDLTTLHMNGGHYVSVSEYKLKIEVESYTSYVCAATQEEANTSKPPLCEYVASQLKDGIQIQNSLVESTGPKISNGGQGDNGDCPYSKYCGAQKAHADPINSKTGSLSLTVVDLSVPTSAGTLAFQRSYSSSATSIFTGVFGPGWTHNHDVRLIFPEDPTGLPGYVLFKGILGNEYFFKINEDGSYQPMPGVMATLTRTGQGETAQYAITSRMQTGFTFDATGKVLTRTDAQGNGFEYSYDGEGKLSRISADGGQRFIELNYDAQGRIVSAEDHANRQVTYNYNAEGDLNDLTDILGKNWSYLYDDAHRITRMSDPDGGSVTTEYDMQGRAYRQFDAKGNRVVLIVYNEDGSATVTGANGTESTDVYDPLNALSDSIDPLGGTTATERDAHYNPTSITDPGGDTTGLTWSEDGANLLEVTDAAGQTSSLTYDSYNNLTGVTDSA